MVDRESPNLAMLRDVAQRIEPILPRLAFLGGVATELFITAGSASPSRATSDVDVVIDLVNYGQYAETLREDLSALRLEEDTREGAPRCRWRFLDAPRQIIDIMPTKGEILGFSTRWYADAFRTAQPFRLPGGPVVRLVTPAYFVATKLAAFHDRGCRDPIASHDLEDLIAVVDGRDSLAAEIQAAPNDVRLFIASSWQHFLETGNAPAFVAAHLAPDDASQARATLVLSRIDAISRLGRDEP